ncbi:MAG: cation:proton antiporter [Helicobacteraceae bacterium]|jgi:Kef-type K+ transport system membrane component KefB|nr:cation:proton antiporter [Helicobacteraceae bacterium]
MENISLIASLSLLIVLSPFFSRVLGFPVSVAEIILGSIAAFLGFVAKDNALFYTISQVGFLYLMFLAGMEVDLKEFASLKAPLIRRIALFFALIYSVSLFLTITLKLSPIYIAALPTISVGMIMALARASGGAKAKEWLSFALTLGIIGELLSICALTILSGLVLFGGFTVKFFHTMAILGAVLLAIWLIFSLVTTFFWWFPRLKKLIMPDHAALDEDVRISIALFFALISAALILDLELVLGAFVAGMFISNYFKHKEELPHKLSSLGFGFLVPIFFVYVGSTLDLRLLIQPTILVGAILIVLGMVLVRILAAFIAFHGVFGAEDRLKLALVESMPLTFLVAIATIGYKGELIGRDQYSAFILASMLEAVLIMVMIKILDEEETDQNLLKKV